MSVKCRLILDAMEQLAPHTLAASWDAIGLQIGSPEQAVDCILVALDVSEATVAEAIAEKANLIISHHPAIFKPLNAIRTDSVQGLRLQTLLKHDIALFSAHTNLDIADGGVNDILARRLKLEGARILRASSWERLVKLAVFIPDTHVEAVRQAVSKAGAGHIGNYSHCTFQAAGTGTFLPLAGTAPYLGEQGKLEYVSEYRLETIMPEPIVKQVVAAMLAAHPYEEVAYDLYPLHNQGTGFGLGRIGELAEAASLRKLAAEVRDLLGAGYVRFAGDPQKNIVRVAVCGGSGSDLIDDAVQAGADVLITGDIKYHEAQQALSAGLGLIDAGHFFTEKPVVDALAGYLQNYAALRNWKLRIVASTSEKDVFQAL